MGRFIQAYRVVSHSTVFEPWWLLNTKRQWLEPIREPYQRLSPVRSQARCPVSSGPFFISHKPCNLQHREVLDGESNRIDGRWPFFQLSTTLLHADSRTKESRVEGLRTTGLRLSFLFSQSSIWGRFVLATYSWKQFSLTRNPWQVNRQREASGHKHTWQPSMRECLFRRLHWPRHARPNFSSTLANQRPWNSIWSCQWSPHKCEYGQHVQSRDGQSPIRSVRSDFLQRLHSRAVQYRSSRLFSARRWRWRGFVIFLGLPELILGIRWFSGIRAELKHIPDDGILRERIKAHPENSMDLMRKLDEKINWFDDHIHPTGAALCQVR